MEIPQEGKYDCKLNGQLVIYEAPTGSLCGAVPCTMLDTGFTFKHTLVLVKSDGTIQTKTTDTLKFVFGWDGADPFWLTDNSTDEGSMREVVFEIVGGPETGDKGGQYFKSQWLNVVGGGMKLPRAADRRSVMEKYGGKFQALAAVPRATASPTPAKSAPAASKAPQMPKTAPSAPPPGGPTATMEGAWAALNEAQPGKPAEEIEQIWFDTIAKLFPNKSNTDLKPRDWVKLKVAFADDLPM